MINIWVHTPTLSPKCDQRNTSLLRGAMNDQKKEAGEMGGSGVGKEERKQVRGFHGKINSAEGV